MADTTPVIGRQDQLRRIVRSFMVIAACCCTIARPAPPLPVPGQNASFDRVSLPTGATASTGGADRGLMRTVPHPSLGAKDGAPAPSPAPAGRPKLYDNTIFCSAGVQSFAVGGGFSPSGPPLWLRDWFTTSGGRVSGFDLYVVNGGEGAVPNDFEITFYSGTDVDTLGDEVVSPRPARFRNFDPPALPQIPVHRDAVTGQPRTMRVSVDYDEGTFTIVDALDDTPLINPPTQALGDARTAFVLPAGKIGVDVRFTGEVSLCASGAPVCGPVLARGGSGNENGLHIINAELCQHQEFPLLCDNPGWRPLDFNGVVQPCRGADDCTFNQPYFGIALTLYAGGTEDQDGNNRIDSADVVTLPAAAPCTSTVVTHGFIGDNNSEPRELVEVAFFDVDENGVVDLPDFAFFQQCFGKRVSLAPECLLCDNDQNDVVDLEDYFGFVFCQAVGLKTELCTAIAPDGPLRFADVDLYEVTGLTAGNVLSILVDGDKTAGATPLWDPFLRVFTGNVKDGLVEIALSDDFERFSFDAFTTIEVPTGINSMFVGVSAVGNRSYDPTNPQSITQLSPDQIGGYGLRLTNTNPNCVVDDASGGPDECYVSRHEPDDSLADADIQGDSNTLIVGAIGDGAFADMGQDVDIYRINLGGPLAAARSLSVRVADDGGVGFETVFDLALALYDSAGNLVAAGDQASVATIRGLDQSRPQLAANVAGTDAGGDGIYYIAVFGTDRNLFDIGCNPTFPATAPTFFNLPHGIDTPGTTDSDLRPIVAGRIHRPASRFAGCVNPATAPGTEFLQCYRLVVLPSTSPLTTTGPEDVDDGPAGSNDSIADATTSLVPADRLSQTSTQSRYLGNGPYGGWQGDVDFYRIDAQPGQTIAVNIADTEQPPVNDHNIRSYLALYDSTGVPVAFQGFSLEHFFSTPSFVDDDIADEIAATMATTIPPGVGPFYVMVGIDSGNLLPSENLPFDPFLSGTTLSRRFETKTLLPREYNIAVALIDPISDAGNTTRMFVVPRRGVDASHPDCTFDDESRDRTDCFPPILELDSVTGRRRAVINGAPLFLPFRGGTGFDGLGRVVSSDPLVAYDGQDLYVTVETCRPEPVFCIEQNHPLFRIDPDAGISSAVSLGNIAAFGSRSDTLTGMTEIDGTLYALNTNTNSIRFWDKTQAPIESNGGTITPTRSDPSDNPRWDDLDGDIGSSGSSIFVACTYQGGEHGICIFVPNPKSGAIAFAGKIDDPITNTALIPGPRLGGLDVINSNTLVTSDRNGSIIQHTNFNTDRSRGLALPNGFVVDRIAIR